MKESTKKLSYEDIQANIRLKKFMPIYLFHGDESYYIDQLTNRLAESVVEESDRDFNQTVLYGLETNAADIINACRRYPMGAPRQLVIVKEMQNMKKEALDDLLHYVERPMPSTVLVLNYKHEKIDGRKKIVSEIEKKGIVFESKKLYDNQVAKSFIIPYLRDKQITIEDTAAQLLADSLGTDLSKIAHELDKLTIVLPDNARRITTSLVEKNIGISKDFNNFELQRAIAVGDKVKAQRIVHYFEQNQKANPYVLTLTVLFSFFTNLMVYHYSKDKSQAAIMKIFNVYNPYDPRLKDYETAIQRYNATKSMRNIGLIREYDAKGKGFCNSTTTTPTGKLLIELLYKLMH
ncbi:MAG: DNA polymerase III subunit delta [Candidatus Symbiothrix sp.]|jgi:DNA polymerase-3 subunit delta|nr:DNA polymerase III subunit delta [Candidatus Symbiothrix sp.]